jgi:hypothetical protein
VPNGAPLITSGVAAATIAACTDAGVNDGVCERRRAAAPATCGAAIDVPLSAVYEKSLPLYADVTLNPGA